MCVHSGLICMYGHYDDVIMGMLASQITSLTIVYSIDYSGGDQRKITPKLRVTGLCVGNSPGSILAQMVSNAENVSIWWRHHVQRMAMLLEWNLIKTYWGRVKMAATLQTTFAKPFFLNEYLWIPIKILLNFFLRVQLTTFQHSPFIHSSILGLHIFIFVEAVLSYSLMLSVSNWATYIKIAVCYFILI